MKATYPSVDVGQIADLSTSDPRLAHMARWISNTLCPPLVGLLTLLLVGNVVASSSGWFWITVYIVATLLLPSLYDLDWEFIQVWCQWLAQSAHSARPDEPQRGG